MLTNSNRIVKVLGGVVGVNLTLALAVSAGAVPHPGADNGVRAASVGVEQLASPARQPGDTVTPPQDPAPSTSAAGPAAVRSRTGRTRIEAFVEKLARGENSVRSIPRSSISRSWLPSIVSRISSSLIEG